MFKELVFTFGSELYDFLLLISGISVSARSINS